MNAQELIAKIQDKDEKIRSAAVLNAGEAGAPAVPLLADIMATGELETARAGRNALRQIVRHAGRPGAEGEAKTVAVELLKLCRTDQPAAVCREAMWLASEIAGDEAVEIISPILANAELREDARMVLQRLPGERSLATLKAALASAPDDFKPNLAVSLRQRGVDVSGVPDAKLVPTKATKVTPVGR